MIRYSIKQEGFITLRSIGSAHCGVKRPLKCSYSVEIFTNHLDERKFVLDQDDLASVIKRVEKEDKPISCEHTAEVLTSRISEKMSIDPIEIRVIIAPKKGRHAAFAWTPG